MIIIKYIDVEILIFDERIEIFSTLSNSNNLLILLV